ncbi:AI-2E family transporter [Olivibacter sp. SDN3]|uniref:AI-2E family transporter n=1 Tax=Olivibacter sp. SDN3 TaxID=2764720 RepID=UPI0016511C08|nr:AI-2E family transporter [Olivibacter sp. SDN3]QNL48590.1 AI-2E family transporter [Olivibacter sp. SDN3]
MRLLILPFYVKLACVLLSILLIGYLAVLGHTILAPLIFGFLCAILLLPLANFLERKFKLSRALSSLLSSITLLIIIASVFTVLGTQLSSLAKDWPAFKQQVLISTSDLQLWISQTFHVNNQAQIDYINEAASKSLSTGTTILSKTLISLSSLFLLLLFSFLYTFFILYHRRLIVKFLVNSFKEKHSAIVYDIVHHIQYIVKRYIVGLFLQMVIVTIMACSAFYFIGVKYSFLLGLITGIFNIIPYIGIFTALLLTILITFATSSATHVLFVIIAIIVIHAIDGNYIMPKIVGSKVQINTLIALIGLVLGEMLWGITGMFLSIPVIAIIKVVFDRVPELKPWGMLLGEDTAPTLLKQDVLIITDDDTRGKDSLQ